MTISETQAFGKALRAERVERELSQEAAAQECRIDRAYFGKIERAEQAPTVTMIWKIARGLGVQPSDLFARAEDLLEDAPG